MSRASHKPRVLHVVHSLECGGAEVLVRDLVAQRADAYHFHVLSLSGDGPLARQIESLGAIVHRYHRQPGFDRGCCKAIARIVREHRINIIHAHQYSPWVYAALARLHGAWRAKVIYTEHGRPYPDYRKPKRVVVNRLALLPLTHRVTVVSRCIGKALQRHEAIPARRIELIYNGVDPSPWLASAADVRRAMRGELGIADDQTLVLQVAGFRPVKDHATAMRAMSHLRDANPNVRLALAGEGETFQATRDLVDQLGLHERVLFLGRRNDVAALWHAADIGLLSSLSEGTSVAIMEAMAAGKPVVATDVGGNPELVQRNVTGLLTPRENDRAMAEAIALLAGDSELRQRLGKAGRQRINQSFNQTPMHDQFCAMYQNLAGQDAETATGERPLIIFADDFGRHPSNMQHLARQLAADRRIVWVNTIGMRRFKPCLADIKRAATKIARWVRPSDQSTTNTPANIRVIHPIMWPSFAGPMQRWLNRQLLGRALNRAARSLPGKPQVITTLPITADLHGISRVDDWTYYIVDDHANWPGNDGRTLAAMHRKQLNWVTRIITVSAVLREAVPPDCPRPAMLTHGIDINHWQSHPSSPIADQIEQLPGIKAVFWGLIDARLDADAIKALAASDKCSVVLVGPTQGDVDALLNAPGVHHTGPAPHEALPAIAAAADVLVMPYASLAATRAMQPLKLKEYLATGKPVACLPLPALHEWADACDVVQPEDFVARVLHRAAGMLPESQTQARRRLAAETWQAKAQQFAAIIADRPGRSADLAA